MQQQSLWANIETQNVSIPEVANQLQVSIATIHNWIKVGYLHSVCAKTVTKESVDMFVAQYIGQTKLVSRANKLHKIGGETDFDIATYQGTDISVDYESTLSDAYRNQEGIFYTPEHIVTDMLESVSVQPDDTFLEPCCGSGNFVIAAIHKGFLPENIYAFDTDKNAVEITRHRIYELTGYDSKNIVCADFLQICPSINRKFDYIYTNPPWGKKLPKHVRDQYADSYNVGNSKDTSALFFFACLSVLKENGNMGLLLPEAFFNVAAFETARQKMLSLSVKRLTDYGKIFGGVMTKAMGVELDNTICKNASQLVTCEIGKKITKRTVHSFLTMPRNIFNLAYTEQATKIIEYMYALPHITLKNNARWGLGIVTGNNKEKCLSIQHKGYVPVYRGKDITSVGLLSPTLFISETLEGCQQVAPMSLYLANEKLIYRFISNKLVFYCDREQRYVLNSANMLVLNETFPLTGQQTVDLLNSKFMNWLFQMLFGANKVLRSDLELLPICIEYFQEHKNFNENEYLNFINIEERNGTYRIKE
ncbi:MAG: N-6 DNA methylase [Paludibacter sp.]|nr:N-6 DNA methylase [Bacteroidales bacterium]MCM1069014.1 N-6 DNA methylase [Prevotella sp.]MCM1353677.1 N-6 DNA methylase [Bacteroides sp.]MCM1441974.1 N-6 DNA methylase [Muribaculum sp.]MCM1481570.1 N-6 DNA methylase [Paludibacter sp.]